MIRLRRTERPVLPADVRAKAGDRVLAQAMADGGWLLGTRSHLVHVPAEGAATRLAWSQVQSADWSQDTETLSITEVGERGHPRPRRTFRLEDADRLLQLVRERVQASIVLQRHTPVRGKAGVTVVVRRRPEGTLTWLVEYDEGVDPEAPETTRVVHAAMSRARDEVGASPI